MTNKIINVNSSNIQNFGTQFKLSKNNQINQMKKNTEAYDSVFFKIIIPNYNNIAYIKKCLDSVLNQTFQDFKIVIVDDLSTDLSDKFCEIYSRKYLLKIIYYQLDKKGYAGKCRNIAIDDITFESQYTIFLDSDDWLYDNDVLKKLYLHITKLTIQPLMVRVPLFHYYGEKDKRNYIDIFNTLNKKDIYMTGPGPGRTCISSKLKCHFIENRANSNDVIWFLRCIDQIKDDQIAKIDFPFYVYNRISSTSCQNSIAMQLNKKVIDDYTVNIVNDLKSEKFNTTVCNEIKQYEIQRRSNIYKQINIQDILKNSYVITIDSIRYQRFLKIFSNANLIPLPNILAGETSDKIIDKRILCKASHIKAVLTAKQKKLPYVLIFEDDAYPCKDIRNKLSQYLQCIPSNANIVLLGWSSGLYHKYVNIKPFNKIYDQTISGAHSYIIFEKAYDKWLYLMNNAIGRSKHSAFYPPDNYIFYDIGNSYIINSPLFIQYNSIHSMNKHIAYIFNGDNTEPPNGFEKLNVDC